MEKTPELMQAVEAQQDANFQAAMEAHTYVGKLTGWRQMKNHKRREQIMSGRAKILSLIFK